MKVGVCGEEPSWFLVKEGIDTTSVIPDSILKTLKVIHQIDK